MSLGHLLPKCPFCGGGADLCDSETSDGNYSIPIHYVKCNVCGSKTKDFAEGPSGLNEVECKFIAIETWSRRTK